MKKITLGDIRSAIFMYLFVVLSISCGNVDNTTPDPSLHSDAGPQKRCDLSRPFSPPTLVSGLNSDSVDWNAQLTADELLVFFSSNRSGSAGFDIYWAKRATREESFGPPVRLTSVDTAADERTPAPTADGLTLYFFRNDDIYVTTRSSRDADFGAASPVSAVNTTNSENDVYVTDNGIYFNRTTPSGYVILRSRRLPSGDLATPEIVAELSSSASPAQTSISVGHPVLSMGERVIFYYSNRSDGGNIGKADIWMSSRISNTGIFENQADISELNSAANDAPNWLSLDGCVLYLESDRSGGIGSSDLYVAERPR